jgi:hypothetical protein
MKSIIFWDMTPFKLNGLHGDISQMILFNEIIVLGLMKLAEKR